MKKFISIFSLLLSMTLMFSACGGGSENNKESFENKKESGISACFNESLGYYNESPSVIETAGDRYMFYTRNSKKNDDTTDTIAVRKGVYSASGFTYGDYVQVLEPTENKWDSKSVFGADVVKGTFSYNSTTYSYLMAYSGSNETERKNAQIGLAVSNSLTDGWVKIPDPVVTFNSTDYDAFGILNYRGAVEPSLVSFDKLGKVYLFYSFYENLNSTYVLELDLSNLNNIVKGGRKVIDTSGLMDQGVTNTQLYCADYVLDDESNTVIAIRNIATTVTVLPRVSESLQIVSSSKDVLNNVNQEWEDPSQKTSWWSQLQSGTVINADTTAVADESSKIFGYERIFNGCIVSDEYGWLLEYGNLDIYFTTQSVYGDSFYKNEFDYKYSQMIHYVSIEY